MLSRMKLKLKNMVIMQLIKNFSLATCLFIISCQCLWGEDNLYADNSQLYEETKNKQSLSSKDALDIIKGQLEALRAHDIDKAYYAFTTKGFRNATSREMFQRFIYSNSVLFKNLSADFKDPTYQNNMVIFDGVLTSIDNKQNRVEYALIQEDGQWKILGINVLPLK